MLNGEPEYRRRVRQKAEEDERQARHERKEATQDRRVEKAVAALEALQEKIDRYADENSPQNKSKRRWDKLEVFGLWAAAAVGLIAVYVASNDSQGQRDVMNQQLRTMQ